MSGNESRASGYVDVRFGATLLEMLVCLGVIAVLLGVLLPALGGARESSRRLACGANLSQTALSLNSLAEDSKTPGMMPVEGGRSSSFIPAEMVWPYAVERFRNPEATPDLRTGTIGPAFPIDKSWRCPSDREVPRPGFTNYVANANRHSWSSDLGAFYSPVLPVVRSSWPDGTSQTALISERVANYGDLADSVPDPYSLPGVRSPNSRLMYYTDVSLSILDQPRAFDIFRAACSEPILEPRPLGFPARRLHGKAIGTVGVTYHHALPPNGNSCWLGRGSHDRDPSSDRSRFYATVAASSEHAGGANVAFADRSVRLMSESIEQSVWDALGTAESGDVVGDF